MTETSFIEYWWLIPLILMLVCIFGRHSCCSGWSRRSYRLPEQGTGEGEHDDAALTILNRRYARSEIDDEEYLKKREVLTGTGQGDG